LPVPWTKLRYKKTDSHYVPIHILRIQDIMDMLLQKYPFLLLGGLPIGPTANELLLAFWENYREFHPTHQVFQEHASRLGHVIPLAVHGDEGRGLKKQPFAVFSAETVFGLSTADRIAESAYLQPCTHCPSKWPGVVDESGQPAAKKLRVDDRHVQLGVCMAHNGKEHSYLSRFLSFCMPCSDYKDEHGMLDACMTSFAEGMQGLFKDGISAHRDQYYFALVGSKGDMKWHQEIANLTRSYNNLGVKNAIMMCADCHAGAEGFPHENVNDDAEWMGTEHIDRPWTKEPIFSQIPFEPADGAPEKLYKCDVFHVWKLGSGRDFTASCIVLLCSLSYFDFIAAESKSMPNRLKRAHGCFALWCAGCNKHPHLRQFTQKLFHMPKVSSMPWGGYKGSDTMLLSKWLAFYVGTLRPKKDSHAIVLRAIKEACQAVNEFFLVLHSHGLYLRSECAEHCMANGRIAMKGYSFMARQCVALGRPGFSMKPKLHAFHHILNNMKKQLDRGSPLVLSPLAFACEVNEDFIGRVSRQSRKVSNRTVKQRTIEYYRIKAKAVLSTYLKKRRR
jgi:hypothetical protein